VSKKRVSKYPLAFRRMALERLKTCASVTALSQELGIDRTLLYRWQNLMEPEDGAEPTANARVRELRKQNRQLKRLLADKTLEVDFFKGALHKIEARRQGRGGSGGTASTTRSGK